MGRDTIIDELHKPGKSGTLVERAIDEIDRLRVELAASDKLAGDYYKSLREASDKNEALKADNTAKDARIAALQGGAERYWEGRWREADARAESAEGLIVDLEEIVKGVHFLRKRAETAEADCKALRAALEQIAHGIPGLTSFTGIARAALDPSPAWREG